MGGCCLEAQSNDSSHETVHTAGAPVGATSWAQQQQQIQPRFVLHTQHFSFAQLAAATEGFSDSLVLGEGGFGRVYKGRLPNGLHVAIKRLDRRGQQGDAEFNVEVDMLARLQHSNVVRLLGVCVEGMHRAAVFELQLGGCVRAALDAGPNPHLEPTRAQPIPRHALTWHKRLNVAVGAATGLAYLHEEASPAIIHRDINTNNILLDETDCAVIGDLGLARSAQHWQDPGHGTATLKGTFGYVAPEYLLHGQHSLKSDVWAFGVVLLELLTGQQPVDPLRRQNPGLVQHMLPKLDSIDHTQAQVDPVIRHECISAPQLAMFTEVASACLQQHPENRPLMSRVACELQNAVEFLDQVPVSLPHAQSSPAVQPAICDDTNHPSLAFIAAQQASLQDWHPPGEVQTAGFPRQMPEPCTQPAASEQIRTHAADVEWPCSGSSASLHPAADSMAEWQRCHEQNSSQDYEPHDSRWSQAYSNPFARANSVPKRSVHAEAGGNALQPWQGMQQTGTDSQQDQQSLQEPSKATDTRRSTGQLQVRCCQEQGEPWQWRSSPFLPESRTVLHVQAAMPDAKLDAWAPPSLTSSFPK